MEENYKPELGQFLYGQPYQTYGVSGQVEQCLRVIREQMVECKMFDPRHFTPFDNSGQRFKNDVFECNAYSWAECNCDDAFDDDWEQEKCTCGYVPQLYNFKYKDIEISWYKYLGRGMSMNRKVTSKEASFMLIDCLNSLLNSEQNPERSVATGDAQRTEP